MPRKSPTSVTCTRGAQADAVRHAATDNFLDLLRLSELDPAKHLRFANWSGADFRDCDLRACDFTGAGIHDCDFRGALIAGARFDQAEIGAAGPIGSYFSSPDMEQVTGIVRTTDLSQAADWVAHLVGWRRTKRREHDLHLPIGAIFQDAPFAPQLVVIPAGEFMMGSPPGDIRRRKQELPQHLVTISRAFAVGRHAVTQGEWLFAQHDPDWERLPGVKPRMEATEGCPSCKAKSVRLLSRLEWICRQCGSSGRMKDKKRNPMFDHPSMGVSWKDAQLYLKWLHKKTGVEYRLLSEAEWEYCAGVGPYCTVDIMADLIPNDFGMYCMPGKIWEWVEDSWHADYAGGPNDGSPWTNDGRGNSGQVELRVLRGGGFGEARVVVRNSHPLDRARPKSGFRVARMLDA